MRAQYMYYYYYLGLAVSDNNKLLLLFSFLPHFKGPALQVRYVTISLDNRKGMMFL